MESATKAARITSSSSSSQKYQPINDDHAYDHEDSQSEIPMEIPMADLSEVASLQPKAETHSRTSTRQSAFASAKTLKRPPLFWIIIYSFTTLIPPIMFIAIGVAVMALDGTYYHSRYSALADKVYQALLVVPTAFPVIFAAFFSWTLRLIALRSVAKGTTLGTLEQLLGSSTFGGAILTHSSLRLIRFSTIALIFIWALSPLGGQASIRMFSIGPGELEVVDSNVGRDSGAFWYRHRDSPSEFATNVSAKASLDRINAAYEFAIVTPNTRTMDLDPFSNLKIPSAEFIMDAFNELRRKLAEAFEKDVGIDIKDIERELTDATESTPRKALIRLATMPISRDSTTYAKSSNEPWLPTLPVDDAETVAYYKSNPKYPRAPVFSDISSRLYVSLLGLPVIFNIETLQKSNPGRNTAVLETNYFVLNCTKPASVTSVTAAKILQPLYPLLNETARILELDNGGFLLASVEDDNGVFRDKDTFPHDESDPDMALNRDTRTKRVLRFLAMNSGMNSGRNATSSNCTISRRELYLDINCAADGTSACKVDKVRVIGRYPSHPGIVQANRQIPYDKLNPLSNMFNSTPFDGGGGLATEFFTAFSAAGTTPSRATTIARRFLYDPKSTKVGEQLQHNDTSTKIGNLDTLDEIAFTSRLSLLLNTYWTASRSPDTIVDIAETKSRLKTALSAARDGRYPYPDEPESNVGSVANGGLKKPANPLSPFLAQMSIPRKFITEYVFHKGSTIWLVVYFVSTTALLLISIVGMILYITNLAPDVFAYPVSSLLTSSLHGNTPESSLLKSQDKAKLVKRVKVKLVELAVDEDVGRVAFLVDGKIWRGHNVGQEEEDVAEWAGLVHETVVS
ncbi:hypothetical protein DFH27DRAFT_655193 [Peziza echinospora]|nr:hypothetical protein DFH27DRAFT_655193 [Peziza echinospora]